VEIGREKKKEGTHERSRTEIELQPDIDTGGFSGENRGKKSVGSELLGGVEDERIPW
jgi:hypothetical protein